MEKISAEVFKKINYKFRTQNIYFENHVQARLTDLNEREDDEHYESTKQERTQEIEVRTSSCSPKCEQSETHNHCCC
ncbi:hypothetical protein Hanom_Chr04g00347621 [Helianthus anomalus]